VWQCDMVLGGVRSKRVGWCCVVAINRTSCTVPLLPEGGGVVYEQALQVVGNSRLAGSL
jgi:hypothetical protein